MISISPDVRRLSPVETRVIPASIRAGLNTDAIEIHKKPWTPLTPNHMSVVRGNKIFYPNDPGPSDKVLHLAHLLHEIVHVWQYTVLGVGMYSPKWLDRRYHYTLNPGDQLLSFGLEQQAAIVEDAFRVRHGQQHRWAQNNPDIDVLESVVDECRAAMV